MEMAWTKSEKMKLSKLSIRFFLINYKAVCHEPYCKRTNSSVSSFFSKDTDPNLVLTPCESLPEKKSKTIF